MLLNAPGMRRIGQPYILPALLLTILFLQPSLCNGQMIVGTNLDGVSPWGTNQFVDAIKNQNHWRTRNADGSGDWATDFQSDIPANANGWPSQIPFTPSGSSHPQIVHSSFPVPGPGTYKLHISGTGRIKFIAAYGLLEPDNPYNGEREINLTGGTRILDFEIHDSEYGNGQGDVFLEIHQSDSEDPVRDLKLIAPGHHDTFQENPFLPSYTAGLSTFANLRFMDWNSTNGHPLSDWDSRVTPNSYTQGSESGVAIEHQVQLVNDLNKTAWFCIPHAADDNYIRQMARYLRDNVHADQKIMIEYSNETWNFIFSQTTYVQDRGEELNLDSDRWIAGQKFFVRRTVQIWDIFEEEFGSSAPNRLIKVMGAFAGSSHLSNQRMDYLSDPVLNPNGTKADAIAIAPYFGGGVAEALVEESIVDSVTVDQIIARTRTSLETEATAFVREHAEIAAKYDVWLLNYEGGQHLVASFADQNNETLTDKLIAANRHPAMYQLYQDYLDMLNENGVVLHCNFSYVTEPSKYGSWGIYEYRQQPLSEAHKARANADWVADNPPVNIPPVARPGSDFQVVDEDDNGLETVSLSATSSRDFDGSIQSLRWSIEGETLSTDVSFDASLEVGVHRITLTVTDNQGSSSSSDIKITVAPASASSILVQSDFTGSAPGQNAPWDQTSQLDDHCLFSGWRLHNNIEGSEADNAFGFYGIFQENPRTLLQSLANDEYISFEVQPEAGHRLDLRGAELTLNLRRIGDWAPTRFFIYSSLDGFTERQETFSSKLIDHHSPETLSAILPFENYLTNQSIEFRIYTSGGRWAGHEVVLESFRLHGRSEPAPLLLGDVNLDGVINLLDVKPFRTILRSGNYLAEADMNQDGTVNLLDVKPFRDAIRSNR